MLMNLLIGCKNTQARLLIVNTVQSAAVIANYLRNVLGRDCVEHLSTALLPKDRDKNLERVKKD